jgi:hypothetical protein
MRFSLEHRFDAPPDVVAAASNSDDYQALLGDLPNLGERKVKSLETNEDGSIHRVTHYKLGAQLPAPVVAVLGESATWDEIADYDPQAKRWTFEIKPHVLGSRIRCGGSYSFEPDGDGTRRTVDVDIKVKVPLVGGRVENEIKKGLVETMEAEADILGRYLAEQR